MGNGEISGHAQTREHALLDRQKLRHAILEYQAYARLDSRKGHATILANGTNLKTASKTIMQQQKHAMALMTTATIQLMRFVLHA